MKAASSQIPRAPKGLGVAGRALWRRIWTDLPPDMELSEREREVLHLACVQVDTHAALEAEVEASGRITTGSTGQKRVHPAVGEARQAALAAGRLLGLLALPDGDEAVPLTAAQVRAKRAADSRYARRGRGRG